jgi:hypothetical protein
MAVELDGVTISPPGGYLIKQAPGHRKYDFMQEISFADDHEHQPKKADKKPR